MNELTAFHRAIKGVSPRFVANGSRKSNAGARTARVLKQCPNLFGVSVLPSTRAFAAAVISSRVTQWSARDTAGVRAP